PAAELQHAGGQMEADAPELGDADLERDACPCGGLLEDHPEATAREEVVLLPSLPARLEVVCELQQGVELRAREIRDAREVAPLERFEAGRRTVRHVQEHHTSSCYLDLTS